MITWTCTGFKGYWPIGTAAVVFAPTAETAAEALNIELREQGLPGDANPEDMHRFPPEDATPGARVVRILLDGNY